MVSNEQLKLAKSSLNMAQNERWIGENSKPGEFAGMLMLDANTRALLVIAQELKRMNDLSEAQALHNKKLL